LRVEKLGLRREAPERARRSHLPLGLVDRPPAL